MQIQVYSTLGNSELVITDKLSSWDFLKLKLKQVGLFIEGMQLYVGEKKLREKYKEGIPEEDFTVFVMPKSENEEPKSKDWEGFLGKINFGEDGVSYQKRLRNEW